jgi:hypothetical protein
MNINYQWSFSNFNSVTDKDFPGNIIASVNYQLNARCGTAIATTAGVVHLPSPELADFVKFENVTPSHVQDWVEGALGAARVNLMKDGLARQIEKQLKKPVRQLPNSFKMN